MDARRVTTVVILSGILFVLCNLTGAELTKKEPVKIKVQSPQKQHKKVVVNKDVEPKVAELTKEDRERLMAQEANRRDPPVKRKLTAEEEKKAAEEAKGNYQEKLKQKAEEAKQAALEVNRLHHIKHKQEKLAAEQRAHMKPPIEGEEVIEGAGDGPIDIDKEQEKNVKETDKEDDANEYSYDEEVKEDDADDEDDSGDKEYEEVNREEIKLRDNDGILDANKQHKPKRQIPNLVTMSEELFINKMRSGARFIMNVGNLACEKCKDFYQDFRLVYHYFHDTKQHIDSYLMIDQQFIEAYQFDPAEFPLLLYYRHGIPILYDGPLIATKVQKWVEDNRERATFKLTDTNFYENVLVTDDRTSQWIVMLYDPEHKQSWRPLALLEALANRLRGEVHIGVVDVSKNPTLKSKLHSSTSLPCMFLMREHDMEELHFGDTKLTLDSIKETYRDARLNFSERLSKAAVQIKGVVLYTGGVLTVIFVVFMLLCKKVAKVGERRIKKGV